ncbi:hypothetical protein TNCV_2547771 [Trichonephila clavipes]|nr:hypothetical protein TNCV_2547771 [Trichonephila clavipes]
MAHSIGSIPLFLKNFNFHEILNYSAKFSSATGNRSVAANVSKRLKLFDDKFVSKISFTEPDCLVNDDCFIQGFIKAEMKKRMTYKPYVQIRTTCQVIRATCTCPAGGIPAFSTRGLLETDHVILNNGQVTGTTHELAPPSPNYNTTPT